jgi:ubiquinone/menaquinone biosynthesis C-methylase UbiE
VIVIVAFDGGVFDLPTDGDIDVTFRFSTPGVDRLHLSRSLVLAAPRRGGGCEGGAYAIAPSGAERALAAGGTAWTIMAEGCGPHRAGEGAPPCGSDLGTISSGSNSLLRAEQGETMGTVDVYRITNELDGATLDALVVRLEGRGKHPRFAEMMCEYLDAMAIDSARSVLDLGCGTGVAARTIAGRPQFSGRVTGIDLSQHLISTATRLADEDGVGSKVEFRVGDSHGLEVDDGTFDAAVAHTLFSHLDDPQKALREIVRAVRPGGNVGIFDGDYASLTFATSDPLEGKAADEAIINAVVTNPRVMRQMPQLIREAGLKLIAAFPYIVADLGRANFWEGAIKSFVTLLPKAGAMTESQAAEWVAGMLGRSAKGTFFGASNFYGYIA